MKKLNLYIYAVALALYFSACVNDNKSTAIENAPSQQEVKSNDHDGHDHSGHNHDGHDHSGHSHGNDAKKIADSNKNQITYQKQDPKLSDKRKIKEEMSALEQSKNEISKEEYNARKEALESPSTIVEKSPSKRKSGKYDKLPDACSLISDKALAKIVGVDAGGITLKDGSGQSASHARSCFLRWDHKGIANSGVMVQIQDNPVPDEFPEWAAYYIQAKKHEGEKRADGSGAYKYKNLEGIGVAGAYCFELHRYMWRTESDHVFMVAFNLPATEAEEVKWAKAIGKVLMKNYF